jgi:type VI secretion system secreted protein VgrG
LSGLEDIRLDKAQRLISVEVFAPGVNKIVVAAFDGAEELSALSCFRLEVVSYGRALKPSEILGQKLGVAIRANGAVRKFHGVVSRFEAIKTTVRNFHLHAVELTPPAWLLTTNRRYRIFAEQSVRDVVAKVLREGGVKTTLTSGGPQHEYIVEYGESDFAFITRLLEDEGLFYHFDHADAACTMIVGDGSADYMRGRELVIWDEVGRWQPRYQVGASAFSHTAWDYKAVATMDATAKGLGRLQPPGLQDRKLYEYPGRHETKGDADRMAKARIAEHEAALVTVVGETTNPMMRVGEKFKVRDHEIDLPASNQTTAEYVLTRVEHHVRDSDDLPFKPGRDYSNSFTAIPANQDFRPPRATPRPNIGGPQTATVTDAPDDMGRAKVKFHWEENGVSRWARVAQVWAYNKMGSQFFPRIGSEVVVEFLNGDPDQPIIVGMVYNGTNKTPFDLPGNKTQSGVRGANWGSAGVADTSNELRFEDKQGSEEIYIHAQKDFRRVIVHDETQTVEQGDVVNTVKMGNHTLKVDLGAASTDAMKSITLTVGQNSITIDQSGVTIKGLMVKIEGTVTLDAKAPMTNVSGDAMLVLKGGLTTIN